MKTPEILSASYQKQEEQDCACEQAFVSMPNVISDSLCSVYQSIPWSEIALTQDYAIVFDPVNTLNIVVLNTTARLILCSFERPTHIQPVALSLSSLDIPSAQAFGAAHRFAALGLLVQTEAGCACVSSKEIYGPVNVTNLPLTSWLHVTDRCNLRCSYCYLPHVREDMSSETGRAAAEATFRSAVINGFKQVKLKYAGGEPLLRFPLIIELHDYARSLATQHSLELEGVVLSNGTLLTADMVKAMKSLDLRLMISLDGFGAYHDSHRPYAGGRGSFQDVAEAVDLALMNGLIPNISVTISSRTAEGLPQIMEWILERELPFGLNFYRENDLSATQEDMRLDEEKIIKGMLAAFRVIENNLPRRGFLGGIIDRANLSTTHTHTCGVGQNYLVFDQNGQVAKCQMHIRKPITNVHVADPLAVIRADQIGIQNLSVEEKEGCKTCEWKHWCAGGCPLATYRATGRYDIKSPNCNIYKALFPEALRLEGLRLLKYRDDPEVVMRY